MLSVSSFKLKSYVKKLEEGANLSFASPPRVLGEGGFGIVLKASYKSPKDGSTTLVAVKIARKHTDNGDDGYVSLLGYYTNNTSRITLYPFWTLERKTDLDCRNAALKREYQLIQKVGGLNNRHPNIIIA